MKLGVIHEHADSPENRHTIHLIGESVGCIGLASRGRLVVGHGLRVSSLDRATGELCTVIELEEEPSTSKINDGRVAPDGSFWFGTVPKDTSGRKGSLYSLDSDGNLEVRLHGVSESNGMDWDETRAKFYHVDSGSQVVTVFDYDPLSLTLSKAEPFVSFSATPHLPDGLLVDDHGGVWVALWGGGEIRRFTPDGSLDVIVDVPIELVTSCAFGGKDLGVLFITSERDRTDQVVRASVFRAAPGFSGRPSFIFGKP